MRRVFVLLAFAAALGLASCQHQRPLEEGLPHGIVLITLDTLRADHLSSYGYERRTSPNIDRFAAGGVRFERVVSPMPTTDPAHVSMLTGLYPRTHGVIENGLQLADPSVPNLAEWAQRKGYRSGAFVSRKHLVPSELALRGFDKESGPEGKERRGDETLEIALSWLEARADQPFFIWFHLFDPHYTYEAPAPYGERYAGPGHAEPVDRDNNDPSRDLYNEEQLRLLEDLYDGEIAYTDHLVGLFLEQLDALMPEGAGPPLVVLTADHGELMDEIEERHRFCFDHGKWLYQGALEVPLVVHWPGRVPAGVVRDELVELVDLPATLLGLMDQARFTDQGESLVPLIDGQGSTDSLEPRHAFSQRRRLETGVETSLSAWQRLAVQDERYKLIRHADQSMLLYDLLDDPLEQVDLSENLPAVRARLETVLAEWESATPEVRDPDEAEITGEKKDALRALGYID